MKTITASNSENARKLIESKCCDVLILDLRGHDRIKKLFTIITPVIARIAHTNNVAIGIDAQALKKSSSIEKASTLARLREAIKYCRKTRTKLAVNLPKHEAHALLLSLGASTEQLTQAITQPF
ncbi:MAG TPA: hypothetical protein VJK07_03090 [Candidatus Nanoarchaeia archaeon]|nr:hypothetical protein [Candidatus Nanoarchaeia archaeon]